MSDATMPATPAKAPWHLWVVGVLALLWNGYASYDYLMTQTQGEAYLRQMRMTDAQIAHYAAYPLWVEIAWAVGVWGGLIGAVLLLLRFRYAVYAFAASLIAFAASLVYNYGLSDGGALYGQAALIMNTVIGVVCVALTWYAWAMAKRGVLR